MLIEMAMRTCYAVVLRSTRQQQQKNVEHEAMTFEVRCASTWEAKVDVFW